MLRTRLAFVLISALMFGFLGAQTAQAIETELLPISSCKALGNNLNGQSIRYEDSGHIEDWSNFLKPIGTIRTLVLPVDFSDVPAQSSISSIESRMAEVQGEISRLSKKKATLEITVHGSWIRMPQSAQSYMSGSWTTKINDALRTSEPLYDFKNFDLVLIKTDELNKVINVAGALPMWSEYKPDGVKVIRGAYLGTDGWTSNGQGTQVAVHEIMHVFGLPDLYNLNPDGTVPVGIYDLMSYFRKEFSLRIVGWHSWKLGWLDDRDIRCISGEKASQNTFNVAGGQVDPLVIPRPGNKYLVVEQFTALVGLGSPGVIVYEVDPKAFVWTSNSSLSGKTSPIQILRPENAPPAPKDYGNNNLNVTLDDGETLKHSGLTFKASRNGWALAVTVTPDGQESVGSIDPVSGIGKTTITCMKGTKKATFTGASPKCPTGYKKVTSIKCTKGSSVKAVTGVAPKCPTGWRKASS